jgi:hypothetical protein
MPGDLLLIRTTALPGRLLHSWTALASTQTRIVCEKLDQRHDVQMRLTICTSLPGDLAGCHFGRLLLRLVGLSQIG